ncbi:HAD-IA family hydrolase [Patescibacteria group bacterium]|nr:HAD-IA family hydrolase [Patescibacteria group bacterium]MBU1868253.1 HAD-IA family hydrolase [Patescibacteria group bacterium]
MINTIIFDFGGVLGTDADTIFIETLENNGFTAEKAKEIWRLHWPSLKLGSEDVDVLWRAVGEKTKTSISIIINEYNDAIAVDESVLNLCKLLRDNGYKLGILANEAFEWMNIKRDKGRLSEVFDAVCSSADLGIPKPDPRSYKLILDKIGSRPEETLFVDNLKRNTKAAETLGIECIVFRDIDQLRKELKGHLIRID